MSPVISFVNQGFSVLTILGQIAVLILLIALINDGRNSWSRKIISVTEKYWRAMAIFLVAGGIIGSLFYSEFANFPPCSLCWYQRIFLYPQIILLIGSLIWKDKSIARYLFPFSIIGGIFALYNSYLQYGGSPLVPCGTEISAINCAQRFIFEFGYITMPLMSLTIFIILSLLYKVGSRNQF